MVNDIYRQVTDEEIIRLIIVEGQSSLYDVLYHRYHHKVFDKCSNLLGSRDLAEDFTQAILSKVFEKLPEFQFRSSFSSWVYSITYHQCIDYLRKKKRLHYPEWNRVNEIPEIMDEQDFEEEHHVDQYELLMRIMNEIHPEEKALLLMKYQDNLSHKEIGEALQISESAAKMRLKRAKARVLYLIKSNQLSGQKGIR